MISALPTKLTLLLVLAPGTEVAMKSPQLAELKKLQARFAPVDLKVDLGKLGPDDKKALGHILRAAEIMNTIFLRQEWDKNDSTLAELKKDASPLGKARLDLFLLFKGPWDRLEHNQPFIPGAPPKPQGANFYPWDATKAEIEAWQKALPDNERTRATGFFTVIRRGTKGGAAAFQVAPYATEYRADLEQAAKELGEAAKLTSAPTLKTFLEKRAKAFLTDDYYESDVAWMELDAPIEPTIGPYEVYEDEWFNAKAAYEAFVTLRDDAETKKLARFSSELQDLEDHLPIDPALRNKKLGALAPIRVVNELFCSGDADHGVQTAAFNLPNDERVVKEKGTKRVMLKNVQEAKFKRVLVPISKEALSPADQKKLSFDAFFTHILMHELMHGLGPHNITVGGKAATVREMLKETYSAIEEAKADISGLWAMQYLADKGVIDRSIASTMYVTYLASSFRSIRFGLNEAHGKGIALQLNYLLDQGGFRVGKGGRFEVVPEKIKEAVASLTRELMTLQAEGDHAKAVALIGRLAVVRPEAKAVLDRLTKVPVDIAPRFTTAEALLRTKM